MRRINLRYRSIGYPKMRKFYIQKEKIPNHLRLSNKEIEKRILNKIKELRRYFEKSGFKKAIIGVSGGLDSAVSAVLAVRALNAKNIYLVRMPYYGISSKKGLKDAEILAKNLKIPKENLITIPINQQVDQNWKKLCQFTPHHFLKKSDGEFKKKEKIRKGNLMARERMKILFGLSSALGAIVIGTENKTEERLGYFTIGGDHCSGIEPILDLWKTQEFYLSEKLPEIPGSILNKVPSAELWKRQTDEKEIGVNYLEIDTILSAKEDLGLNKDEINQKFKISLRIIDLILNKAKKAEGKRNLPYVLRDRVS